SDGAAERAIELRDGVLQDNRLGDGNGQHVDVGRRRRCRGGGDLHLSSLWSGEGTAQGYPNHLYARLQARQAGRRSRAEVWPRGRGGRPPPGGRATQLTT